MKCMIIASSVAALICFGLRPPESCGQTAKHPLRRTPVGESVADNELVQDFMKELHNEQMQWRNEIEFYGTFIQRDRRGETLAQALQGVDIGSEEDRHDDSQIVATGLFAKKGLAFRYRQESNQILSDRTYNDGLSRTVTGLFSMDLSAARGVEFELSMPQPTNAGLQVGSTIYFTKLDYMPREVLWTKNLHYFPFEVAGGSFGNPFHRLPRANAINYEFENTDNGFRITVSVRHESEEEEGYALTSLYEFRDTVRGPILERRTHDSKDSDGLHGVNVAAMFDFTDCGQGYLFPRGMLVTSEPKGELRSEYPQARCRATSWYSEDVGKRPPTNKDFDVKVPAGFEWWGYDPIAGTDEFGIRVDEEITVNVLKINTGAVLESYRPAVKRSDQ